MKSLVQEGVKFLTSVFGEPPRIAVVLGSGLSPYAETLKDIIRIDSENMPGAARSTVLGHKGEFVLGKSGNTKVIVIAGRVHGFEGHSPTQVVHNLRALRIWGVQKFILTNAAGSTSLRHKPGNLVLLKDHINLTGQSPLTGLELYDGPRFPDMTDAYSKAWRLQVLKEAKKLKLSLAEGVYAGVNGPNYETAAEIRMLAKLGADLVGMSTVWETLALHQMKSQVLGISCVTNYGTGVTKQPLAHEEVIETTQRVQSKFNLLMDRILQATI